MLASPRHRLQSAQSRGRATSRLRVCLPCSQRGEPLRARLPDMGRGAATAPTGHQMGVVFHGSLAPQPCAQPFLLWGQATTRPMLRKGFVVIASGGDAGTCLVPRGPHRSTVAAPQWHRNDVSNPLSRAALISLLACSLGKCPAEAGNRPSFRSDYTRYTNSFRHGLGAPGDFGGRGGQAPFTRVLQGRDFR